MKVYIKDDDVVEVLQTLYQKQRSLLETVAREAIARDLRQRRIEFSCDETGWFIDIEEISRDILFRRFDNIYKQYKWDPEQDKKDILYRKF